MATDDAQVIEGNRAHLVESDEDVAAHFFYRLRKKMRAKKLVGGNAPKVMWACKIKLIQSLAVAVSQPSQH